MLRVYEMQNMPSVAEYVHALPHLVIASRRNIAHYSASTTTHPTARQPPNNLRPGPVSSGGLDHRQTRTASLVTPSAINLPLGPNFVQMIVTVVVRLVPWGGRRRAGLSGRCCPK